MGQGTDSHAGSGTGGDRPPQQPRRRWFRRRRNAERNSPQLGRLFHHEGALDDGLLSLQQRLGLAQEATSTTHHTDDEPILARPTSTCPSTLVYAPDMDGNADVGEVVWIRGVGSANRDAERPVVIIGHHGHHFKALLISTNTACAGDDHWFDIGSGGWDVQGRHAWVRLDKTLEVPEYRIRRKGAVMPRHRFERIAARLRTDYNWR